jgi:hypothetical protein
MPERGNWLGPASLSLELTWIRSCSVRRGDAGGRRESHMLDVWSAAGGSGESHTRRGSSERGEGVPLWPIDSTSTERAHEPSSGWACLGGRPRR